ncbi:bile acid:sodium symporter [Marmoricola sp. RAF53]|uniref:bile acid:sodium symporter n=1 Tax=Marmoricola sp. RAF53 TaxID=3233059 RepID=UPI003F9D88E2
MGTGELLGLMFQASIVLTTLGYGLVARTEDILFVFRDPRLLVVSMLAMFVVMPAVALALDLYFDFPYAARVALVVLALTPVSAGLPKQEIASGGRQSYAYGLSFAIAALGCVIVPFQIDLLGRIMDRPFRAPQDTLTLQLLGLILLPLVVGLLLQTVLPKVAGVLRDPVVKVAGVLLWVALVVALVAVLPAVVEVTTWRTVAAMAVFIASGLAVGHFIGGPRPDHAIVLAIACANRNPGMAIGIAALNFPAQSFVATMVLYGVLVGLVSKPYIAWQLRRAARPDPDRGALA